MLFHFALQTLYGIVLQHENARPYTARHTTQFLTNNNVQILPWPSLSLDLNPDKHMERAGETCSRQSECPCKCAWVVSGNHAGLVAIPKQVIQSLFQSMPERCWAVIDSPGGHTPYWCACHSVPKYWVIKRFLGWVFKSWTLTWSNCKTTYDELDFK